MLHIQLIAGYLLRVKQIVANEKPSRVGILISPDRQVQAFWPRRGVRLVQFNPNLQRARVPAIEKLRWITYVARKIEVPWCGIQGVQEAPFWSRDVKKASKLEQKLEGGGLPCVVDAD